MRRAKKISTKKARKVALEVLVEIAQDDTGHAELRSNAANSILHHAIGWKRAANDLREY